MISPRSGTLAAIFVGLAGLLLVASPVAAQTSQPKPGSDKAKVVDLKTFSFPLASTWESTKPGSQMRLAQVNLPGPDAKTKAAELVVFHFPGSGGSVDANLQRWKGQFKKPAARKEEDFAKTQKTTADTLPITILEVHGSFPGGGMGPRPADPIVDARMYAVIIETSKGPYFIKVTGPAATVDHHRKALEAMVAGVKRGAAEPKAKPKPPTSRPRG